MHLKTVLEKAFGPTSEATRRAAMEAERGHALPDDLGYLLDQPQAKSGPGSWEISEDALLAAPSDGNRLDWLITRGSEMNSLNPVLHAAVADAVYLGTSRCGEMLFASADAAVGSKIVVSKDEPLSGFTLVASSVDAFVRGQCLRAPAGADAHSSRQNFVTVLERTAWLRGLLLADEGVFDAGMAAVLYAERKDEIVAWLEAWESPAAATCRTLHAFFTRDDGALDRALGAAMASASLLARDTAILVRCALSSGEASPAAALLRGRREVLRAE